MSLDGARADEVRACLAEVTDPELDEDVVALGFVASIAVDGADVRIGFRLPTYWCSANFAWIMADDMRAAALALPWVESCRVELDAHMYQEQINAGVSAGRSFRDAFGDEADAETDNLDEVRLVFRRKSYGRRQLLVLDALAAAGCAPETVVGLTQDALAAALPGDESRRYLARRLELFGPGGLAFLDLDGRPLAVEGLTTHVRKLRSITCNMEFNGALCRGLLDARYAERSPDKPELIDFVREAALRERPVAPVSAEGGAPAPS